MSVHHRNDGRWVVMYRDKESGKTKAEYFGKGLEAEKKARSRNDALGLNPYRQRRSPDPSPYFVELVDAYLEQKMTSMSKVSHDNALYKFQGVIIPFLGNVKAINITPHRVDQYVRKRLSTPLTVWTGPLNNRKRKTVKDSDGTPRTIKATTVHREIADIQAVLNWSIKRGYLTRNPIDKYEKPKRDDTIILPPTEDEVARILVHAPDRLFRALSISYYTGLRPGRVELFSLKWSDIDWNTETIVVRSAQKGGLKYRMVPLHPAFLGDLKEWQAVDEDREGDKIEYIIHHKGRPIQTIRRAFNTAKRKAGIPPGQRLPLYAFRHAFATQLLRGNADLKSTSEILGHSRTDTTTRIYQATDIDMHRAAIAKLPALKLSK